MSFRLAVGVMAASALVLGACGTGMPAPTTSPATTATASAGATPSPAQATPTEPAGGTYEPGSVRFRVVNLTPAAVDVYARTQGVVQAFAEASDLGQGEATDYFAPPDPGAVVVTTAGAGDATCVATCPHIIGSWGNTSGNSDQITIFIHAEGATDLWENPRPADVGTFANALPPGDPAAGTFFAIGRAVEGADFGLRLAYVRTAGCQADAGDSGLLVGGTSVLPFTFDGSTSVTVHDNTDRECTAPIGGPIDVSGADGSRSLLLLYGSIEDVKALLLPVP